MKALEIQQMQTLQEPKSLEFVRDRNVLNAYFREIKGSKSLTLAEEKALVVRIKQGDKDAFNSLVEANLKFVVAVCRKYENQGLPMADLINEGNLGLIRAAQRFDASYDFKFVTYAVWWIRQGILIALAEQSRTISFSAAHVTLIQQIGKATNKLAQRLHRKPHPEEIALEIGKSVEQVTSCMMMRSDAVSLSAQDSSDSELTLEASIRDENALEADRDALRFLLGESLGSALDTLSERERTILKMYFGMGNQAESSLLEIAERMNMTRERIRQIKEGALEKLRRPAQLRRLRCFRN